MGAVPNNVAALQNAPLPQTKKELQSFLGLASYCLWFVLGVGWGKALILKISPPPPNAHGADQA